MLITIFIVYYLMITFTAKFYIMDEHKIKTEKAKISAIFKKKKGKTSYYKIGQVSGLTTAQQKIIEDGGSYTVDSLLKLCSAFNCTLKIVEQ